MPFFCLFVYMKGEGNLVIRGHPTISAIRGRWKIGQERGIKGRKGESEGG